MNHLLEEAGLTSLGRLAASKTLYAFDFDGTLAEISERPWNAVVSAHTQDLLRRLSVVAPIAVVSGRPLDDLKLRIDNPCIRLVGHHGIESSFWDPAQRELRAICREWKRHLVDNYGQVMGDIAAVLEDNSYSLAFRYQGAVDPDLVGTILTEIIKELVPKPRVIQEKFVINLIPMGAPHKGSAVQELMRLMGMDFALYVGDDGSDEDVFGMNIPNLISVRIGGVPSKASFSLRSRSEVDELLLHLIGIKENKLA